MIGIDDYFNHGPPEEDETWVVWFDSRMGPPTYAEIIHRRVEIPSIIMSKSRWLADDDPYFESWEGQQNTRIFAISDDGLRMEEWRKLSIESTRRRLKKEEDFHAGCRLFVQERKERARAEKDGRLDEFLAKKEDRSNADRKKNQEERRRQKQTAIMKKKEEDIALLRAAEFSVGLGSGGGVYCFLNPSFVSKKIGETLSFERRLRDLQTGVPCNYECEGYLGVGIDKAGRRALENLIHLELACCRAGREFFNCTLDEFFLAAEMAVTKLIERLEKP